MGEHSDVTAVIACFNYGRWVDDAVGSLRAQEGGAPRIVVVDDGSTDPATVRTLDALGDDVRLIRQANVGLPAARNAGMRDAGTPFLIALDADDRLPPRALRALKKPFAADPALGFTYGITRFFGEWDGEMALPGYDPWRLLYRHTIGPVGLTRRELFEDIGGYDEAMRAGYEDWDFWLSAIGAGWRGHKVDEVTFEYRRHGETMVVGSRRAYRSLYRGLRRKHAALFARRRELARASDAGPAERLVYRYFWGPRPVPARVEHALYRVVFGRRAR